MAPQPRRKKWSEAEERTLIDKYGEMGCDGTLSKMRTREKKYKPIALHVNSTHHAQDPVLYPWQWSWKDVSTKVQNMRHQYSLVKQKIKKQEPHEDGFDWMDGVTHWSNFLRYKEVFGDFPLVFTSNDSGGFGGEGVDMNHIIPFGGDFVGEIENGVMDLEFDYDGEEDYNEGSKSKSKSRSKADVFMREEGFVCEDIEEPESSGTMRKKRKVLEKKAWGFLVNQMGQLREMESRFEQREVEREQKREKLRRENEEKERIKREEDMMHEREWEERLERRRSEWKKKMDEMMSQHRSEMGQLQARILHEQQNLTSQFLGIVSQWTGITDHNGASGHYLSQMMQNLNQVNSMVHGDNRVEGDNQEDQFIVDG